VLILSLYAYNWWKYYLMFLFFISSVLYGEGMSPRNPMLPAAGSLGQYCQKEREKARQARF